MAWDAQCDICSNIITKVEDITELSAQLAVPGRVESVCKRCSKKISKHTDKLGRYYHKELVADLREYILELGETS